MANKIRRLITNKIIDAAAQSLARENGFDRDKVAWCVRMSAVFKNKRMEQPQVKVPYRYLQLCGLLKAKGWQETLDWAHAVSNQFPTDDVLKKIEVANNSLKFTLDQDWITKETLQDIVTEGSHYGNKSLLYKYRLDQHKMLTEQQENQTVLVEYSSPNIAKIFHAGHLRSTVLGNFIANLYEALGHKVTRINYLGDWGTQFGLLGVGFKRYGNKEEFELDPMKHLYEVYVKINKEAKKDPSCHEQALEYFKTIETGGTEENKFWQTCREVSVKEYKQLYKRLGVVFDEFDGESYHHKGALELLQSLGEQNLLKKDDRGVTYLNVGSDEKPDKVALCKSDGSTLYITRDIVAAIGRHKKFRFDKMYYVVDNGQRLHFQHLIGSLQKLGYTWAERPVTDFHVKFGLVEGMSTRKGQVVFLKDILDEAKQKMLQQMEEKETTKVTEDLEEVADQLGVSALVVQDLKEYRQKNYKFSWERALQFKGDTGVFLQYTHSRLCSLEEICGVGLAVDCDTSCLNEEAAQRLILQLAQWDEALHDSITGLEPCHVVQYLLKLGRLTNTALVQLQVKNTELQIAQARLLLFHCTRVVMATGLKMIGLKPLKKM